MKGSWLRQANAIAADVLSVLWRDAADAPSEIGSLADTGSVLEQTASPKSRQVMREVRERVALAQAQMRVL